MAYRQSREGPNLRAAQVGRSLPLPLPPSSLRPIGQRGASPLRLPFSPESRTCRASEARQARRAASCGQGLRRCGHVGKAPALSICPCRRCSCPSGRYRRPAGAPPGGGPGEGCSMLARSRAGGAGGARGPRSAGEPARRRRRLGLSQIQQLAGTLGSGSMEA